MPIRASPTPSWRPGAHPARPAEPGAAPAQPGDLAPSRIYLVTGAFAIARMTRLDLGAPVDLVIASPRLGLREILAVGLAELWRERRLMLLPLINALLPGRLIARGFRRSGAVRPIYSASPAASATGRWACPPARCSAPGRPASLPRPSGSSRRARPADGRLSRAALGAPRCPSGARRLRGGRRPRPRCRLLMLLRPDVAPEAMRRFLAVRRSPAAASIEVSTEMLGAAEIARRLARSTPSSCPSGPRLRGAARRHRGRAHRPAGDRARCARRHGMRARHGRHGRQVGGQLPHALIRALRQRREAEVDQSRWTSWAGSVEAMLAEPEAPPLRQKLVAFCGVDGTGKSFLLAHLREHYAKAGVPSRHVWSRFRNYLSKPFLALTRLTGHNYKVEEKGIRIGYHDFAGQPLALAGRSSSCRPSTRCSTSSAATICRACCRAGSVAAGAGARRSLRLRHPGRSRGRYRSRRPRDRRHRPQARPPPAAAQPRGADRPPPLAHPGAARRRAARSPLPPPAPLYRRLAVRFACRSSTITGPSCARSRRSRR
jgi:hypothetical protein